jgi:3-oxoacyl-[acyl-carrier protein] reductase
MTSSPNSWQNIRFDYSGSHVLVTGGTSGIGNAIAEAYRAAGAEVTITGTKADRSAYDADLSGFRYLKLDVTDDTDVELVAAAVPAVDILINNAGIGWVGGGMGEHEYEPEIFERAVRMHLLSPYRLAAACQPKLSKSRLPGGGNVVGIASLSSFFGIEVVPGYGAAKAGLVQLTKTLAIHWARENIRVNAVAAGLTESGMSMWMMDKPEWTAPTIARTPLGRIGKPIDVAGSVLFLTSAAANHITGQTVIVDGGYSVFG